MRCNGIVGRCLNIRGSGNAVLLFLIRLQGFLRPPLTCYGSRTSMDVTARFLTPVTKFVALLTWIVEMSGESKKITQVTLLPRGWIAKVRPLIFRALS